MASPQNDALSVAAPAMVGYGGRVAPAPPPPPPAPSITLSSTGAATAGSAYAVTVTAANLTGPLTVTPERVSGPSVTFGPTTVLPAPGELVRLFNLTAAAAGTLQLRATAAGGIVSNTLSVTVVDPPPPPPPPPPGSFGFTFSEGATVARGRNTTTTIATGVPAGAVVSASPGLLPGETLVVNGSQLQIVGDATVPTVDGAAPGSLIDTISARDVRYEVLDSPGVATIVNVTQGITYAAGANYSGRTGSHAAGRWNAVMHEAAVNDVIEVSPGALLVPSGEGSIYYSTSLDSTAIAVWKPVTIRGMSGRGRWRAGYPTRTFTEQDRNGITIYSPAEIGVRGNFTISDFELDDWGRFAASFGLRTRVNATKVNDWVDFHQSVTVRNFKIGRPAYERSASAFAGDAQTWTIEDGHVYDVGGAALISPGFDHNFYIGGQYLYMRGVRSQRSRAHSADGTSAMDGHHAKTTFNHTLLEGCVLDCGPEGDSSIQLQCKGGGNLVVRGCVFIAGRKSRTATGAIVFEREEPGTNDGGWTYGLAGHSVLVERSVFVNHRPYIPTTDQRAFVFFRPTGHPWRIADVSTVTVRDNIGISTVPSSVWINNDPTAGASWTGRGNTARAYNPGEWAFADRELFLYRDALGAPAAGAGSAAVPQFLWPHGTVNVTRSTQGLG